MNYRIVVQPAARAQAAAIYAYLFERAPLAAERWLSGFDRAVQTLRSMPARCALAPESPSFSREIRQLLYGNYRILFTIRGNEVRVLHVRHAARDRLDP